MSLNLPATIGALLFAALTTNIEAQENNPPSALDRALTAIDARRNGRDTPSAELEDQCRALLRSYLEPRDAARIYYQLVLVYSQDGLRTPERCIEFSLLALAQPLEAQERANVHVALSYAEEVHAMRSSPSREMDADACRGALEQCWKGLIPLLDPTLPDQATAVPPLDEFLRRESAGEAPGESVSTEAVIRAQDQRALAVKEFRRIRDLIEARQHLIERCSHFLDLAGAKRAELEGAAAAVLGSIAHARYAAFLKAARNTR
ncbi:MAG: hypothetical protein IPN34_24505 [Planctomycetes bacterium]|nr:hypothetical protein [Planctomycetota bacterium]